jgi:hypothetical protein
MFGNYNPQMNIERIDKQISDLERIKSQLQQPTPTNLTQNFQISPSREFMRYANSIDEVQKEIVYGTTPFFSKDMSVLWVKSTPNTIKTYELKEIINKDEKDVKIEFLMAKIAELEKGMNENAKSNNGDVDEPVESKESSDASNGRKSKSKSK